MKTTDGLEPDLGAYLKQTVSDADLDRQWRRLAATWAQPAPRRRRTWIGAFAVVGAATAIALLLVTGHIQRTSVPAPAPVSEAPFVVEGSRLENQGPTTRALSLADGSQIALAPAGAIVLERSRQDDLRLVLERGSADFDVTHVPGRRFVVVAADVDVVVVGTRFVVTVSDGQQGKVAAVSVSVQRGAVEVQRPRTRAMRFLPGQSWSSATPAPPVTSPPVEPPAESPPTPSAPAPVRPAPAAKAAPLEDTKSLLAVATRARLQGKHREAAAALEKLCRRFPDDPRAPLAAFQLGRIQLDTLHETDRAAASFHTAAALSRDPTLRESAAAREVEALDRGSDSDASACRAARDAYRAAYPTGPHLGRVTAYCRGR
jgi:transmembrane sensor